MSSDSETETTLLFLCLFIIYSGTSIFCLLRILKLHKFAPQWRKAQIFYVLVLIQVIFRAACLLIIASQMEDLSETMMYLLISTPDTLFLISYAILIWQLISLFYFAHIIDQSKQTFISKISKRPRTNKVGCFVFICIILFTIDQGFLYFLLVIGQIHESLITLELDWLNIAIPSLSIIIMILLGVRYSGVPLKSQIWKQRLQQILCVSVYWTATRLFRGLSSIISKYSAKTLSGDLEDRAQNTAEFIMLIIVLIISEILCIFLVQDYGFMGIFIFSEEESDVATPVPKSVEGSESDTILHTSISIMQLTESPIINLSDIIEGEEMQARKHSLGKLYKSQFKDSSVLFRKIALPRLSGYIVEELTMEIEVHRTMNYSHVLPIIGIIIELPVIGFITPLMTKGSLYDALHINPIPLTLTEKIRISGEIATGILNFHMQGKAHGHLTTHNILFDENLAPYICDLGFNKLKKYAGIVSGYTNINAWSSPELLNDKRLTPIKS